MIISGIDPGLKGAIVTIDNKTNEGWIYCLTYTSNKVLAAHKLEAFLKQVRPSRIYLEKNTGRKGWASSASYSMGNYWGQLRYAIARLELSCTEVTPRSWQNELHQGLAHINAKDRSKASYQSLFPGLIPKLKNQRNLHDGVIDALLICAYGFSRYNKCIGSEITLKYWI